MQQIEPGRRRRSIVYSGSSQNWTRDPMIGEAVRIGHRFRVVSPDELPNPDLVLPLGEFTPIIGEEQVNSEANVQQQELATAVETICLSYAGFYSAFTSILVALAFTSMTAALLFVKLQRVRHDKGHDLPTCSWTSIYRVWEWFSVILQFFNASLRFMNEESQ